MSELSILIDTDFHRYADDHEALRMLSSLHRNSDLTIVGITTVTGNAWSTMCAEHARSALKDLELEEVPVVQGAVQPLLHKQSDFIYRSKLYGAAFGGAWGNADLLESEPISQPAPLDNDEQHAVEFIIKTLRAAVSPITILAIGPFTNIALALRIAPDIVTKIEKIVTMGGAFFVPGNVTHSAEFNWWFDPEAAAIVLEQDINVVTVPLDATDKILLDMPRYQRWKEEFGETDFFKEFHSPKFEAHFEKDSSFSLPVWDALTAACLIDESLITRFEDLWVTVDCMQGPSYGRVVCFRDAKEFNLDSPERPRAKIVLDVDEGRFWELYESLIFGR